MTIDLLGPNVRYTNAKARDLEDRLRVAMAEYNDDLYDLIKWSGSLAEHASELQDLLAPFVREETLPCAISHDGTCHRHSMQSPCPVPRARQLLGLEPQDAPTRTR